MGGHNDTARPIDADGTGRPRGVRTRAYSRPYRRWKEASSGSRGTHGPTVEANEAPAVRGPRCAEHAQPVVERRAVGALQELDDLREFGSAPRRGRGGRTRLWAIPLGRLKPRV